MPDATVKVNIPFLDWLTHPLSMAVIGLSICLAVFIGYGLYKGYVKKPEPTQTIGKAGVVDSRQFHQTFGCMTIQAMKASK